MSIYDILLGDPTSQENMAAAARKLRGREALANLAMASRSQALAPMGQAMLGRIDEQVSGLRGAREQAERQALQERQQGALEQHRAASLAEQVAQRQATTRLGQATLAATQAQNAAMNEIRAGQLQLGRDELKQRDIEFGYTFAQDQERLDAQRAMNAARIADMTKARELQGGELSLRQRQQDDLAQNRQAQLDMEQAQLDWEKSKYERGSWQQGPGGFFFNPRTGETQRPEGMEEFIKEKYAQAIEERRVASNAAMYRFMFQNQGKYGVVPEATLRKVTEYGTEAEIGGEIISDLESALEQGVDVHGLFSRAPGEALRTLGARGPAAMMDRVTSSPEAIEMRSAIDNYIGEYRLRRFGATLTGNELSEWAKANPMAYGISPEESLARLRRIPEWYQRQSEGMLAGRIMPGAYAENMGEPVATPSPPEPTGTMTPVMPEELKNLGLSQEDYEALKAEGASDEELIEYYGNP